MMAGNQVRDMENEAMGKNEQSAEWQDAYVNRYGKRYESVQVYTYAYLYIHFF